MEESEKDKEERKVYSQELTWPQNVLHVYFSSVKTKAFWFTARGEWRARGRGKLRTRVDQPIAYDFTRGTIE